MTKWFNYFVNSKNSRLTNGHLPAENLYEKILNHDGGEAYCCYFDLDYDSLKQEFFTGEFEPDGSKIYEYYPQGQKPKADFYKPEITFTQYEGIARPALGMVSFDFDADDIGESLKDVRAFVKWLGVEDIAVFFSGGKGFHVMVPANYFPLEPNPHYPKQLKDIAKELSVDYPTMDTSIYNYNRKFRVPFTRHDKSGLYKVLLNEFGDDWSLDAIMYCAEKEHTTENFLSDIKPILRRKPLEQICEVWETVQRKSYEIEKAKAGTREKPSPFEAYDNKLCIKKMLNSRCDDVGRNNACLRIVNDYYRTGRLREDCEKDLAEWARKVGLPLSEINSIINNIYNGKGNYNFGCQDEVKAHFCTAKCELWRKLAEDKRPTVPDAPAAAASKLKKDFDGVVWLMAKVFGSYWDAEVSKFSLGKIVKQGNNDLFYYKDNHWQYLEEHRIDMIKVRLNAEHGHALSQKRLDAIFKLLKTYIPHVPDGVDLFSPRNDVANFTDGTLHMVHKNGNYQLRFKKHNKEDFLTSMIQSSYKSYEANKNHKNKMFEDWLWQQCEGDKDKYLLVQEMYAATIFPAFAQFFVLLGESGTGKSTVMKVLKKLHGDGNYICGVSPDKFHGFHMSSMIGKTINIVMDIKTNCSIDDDIVKQVDDGEPIRIERKGREDVYALIPPVHIFGGNKMPKTAEAYSGAMNRRFSIIEFLKVFTGKKNKHIADDLYNHDPQGILNFALEGVFRLIKENCGEYTRTKGSQDSIKKWVSKTDVLSQFIDNIASEGVTRGGDHLVIVKDSELSIKKADLWYIFKTWQLDALEKNNHLGKINFYGMMSDHGYKTTHKKDGDYYLNLGLESELNGSEEI